MKLAAARSPRFATLMFGALFIYFVALLFHLPTLFFMASGLLAAPVVSHFIAAGGLSRIRAERRLPPRLWPDERVEVELRVENQAWLPKCLLLLDEHLPDGLEADPDEPPECVVPMLWSEPFTHRYPLTARRRGVYTLPPVVATAVDTFDLLQARAVVGPADEVLVYPRTLELDAGTLLEAAQAGTLRERRLTEGTEFRGTREYRPGDDLRRIHWPSTARQGKPIVIEYEEPTTSDLFIVLDTAPGWGEGADSTFETGVTLAASLVRHELERDRAVGLYAAARPPIHHPLCDNRQQLIEFMEALALVAETPEAPFGQALAEVAELVPRGARVLAVTAGPRDGSTQALLAGLEGLLRRQLSVAVALLDPRGYPGFSADDAPAVTAEALKARGVGVFAIRRGELARGLLKGV